MMRLTRKYRFAASHRLHSPLLSEDDNQALYGKCNNPYGHGHNYEVAVSVRGPVDEATGRVVDLAVLDGLVQREILDRFDHKNLNQDLEQFGQRVPTTENLGRELFELLNRSWLAAFPADWPKLDKIRIVETDRNIFEESAHEKI